MCWKRRGKKVAKAASWRMTWKVVQYTVRSRAYSQLVFSCAQCKCKCVEYMCYAFSVYLDDAYSNKDQFWVYENRTNGNCTHTTASFCHLARQTHKHKYTRFSHCLKEWGQMEAGIRVNGWASHELWGIFLCQRASERLKASKRLFSRS